MPSLPFHLGQHLHPAAEPRGIDALRQRQIWRLKQPLVGMATLTQWSKWYSGISTVRGRMKRRRLHKPRFVPRPKNARKLTGDGPPAKVNEPFGQHDGRRASLFRDAVAQPARAAIKGQSAGLAAAGSKPGGRSFTASEHNMMAGRMIVGMVR